MVPLWNSCGYVNFNLFVVYCVCLSYQMGRCMLLCHTNLVKHLGSAHYDIVYVKKVFGANNLSLILQNCVTTAQQILILQKCVLTAWLNKPKNCAVVFKGSHLHVVKTGQHQPDLCTLFTKMHRLYAKLSKLSTGFCLSAKCCHQTSNSTALF